MSVVQQRAVSPGITRTTVAFDHVVQPSSWSATTSPAAGLSRPMAVALSLTPDGIHAEISGELDCSTAARLERLFRLLEGFPRPVSVDLSGVAFTDSTGLAPLFASAARRAASGADPIRVTQLSYASRRVLDLLSDLDDVQLLTRVGTAR